MFCRSENVSLGQFFFRNVKNCLNYTHIYFFNKHLLFILWFLCTVCTFQLIVLGKLSQTFFKVLKTFSSLLPEAMLELLSIGNFYNFSFYFGILILAIAILFGAWKSTYVPGLQNITVVVLQHPSGRQTVERFTSTRRTTTAEEEVGLQDEVYEEITLTAEDDDADEDDDENEEDSGVEIAILESSSADETDYNITDVSQNLSMASGNLIPEEIASSSTMNNNLSSSSSNTSDQPSDGFNSLVDSPSIVSSVKDVHTTNSSHLTLNTNGENNSSTASVECSSSHCGNTLDTLNSVCTKNGDRNNVDAEKTKHLENESSILQADQDQSATSVLATVKDTSAVLTGISASSTSTLRPTEPELLVEGNSHEDGNNDTAELASKSEVPDKESCPPGSIRIRLKYLDERQKTVFDQLTQNILGFKRNHFNSELAEHRVIRLIFNGRLLKPDSSTLQECGLFDNCVVHCHVSQPKPPAPPSQQPSGEEAAGVPGQQQQQQRRNRGGRRRWLHFLWHASVPDALHDDDAAEGLDLSNYMSALLWLVVAGLWFMRFKHSYMFSTFSTFMLIFLTMLLVVPHYIFSVDVQLSVNLDGNTMRNLGIDRVVVLERLRGRRESSARRERIDDVGTVLRHRTSDQNESADINSGSATPSSTPSTSRDRSSVSSNNHVVSDRLSTASGVAGDAS